MKAGDVDMKLLKIDDNLGYFFDGVGKFQPIDTITKENLSRLVDLTLREEVEFDEYDSEKIKNQAHQIVYKNIYEKLRDLRDSKQEFIDGSERLYLPDYEKYKAETLQ